MRLAVMLTTTFALVPPATPTVPDVSMKLDEKAVFYDVSGLTTRQIAQDIHRRGPGERYGSIVAGNTDVGIEWLLDMRRTKKACVLAGVEVFVDVKTTLPRWTDAARAPHSVRRR